MADTEPTERLEFDAADLMRDHPPRWRDPNKQVVFEVACPAGAISRGTIGYSRWPAMPLPERLVPGGTDDVTSVSGFLDYRPLLDPATAIEWHLNFADPNLFVAYGSSLFAQDEMQVAEHPALGAVREALDASGSTPLTAEHGTATPVLVNGVERRVAIATEPDAAAGRPHGLYGNAFARATPAAVRRASQPIDPPTISNIVAIAAPRPGHGAYRREEFELALTTAYSGLRAAVLESRRLRGPEVEIAIHTGYWGCGAFGGNRVLMALLQVAAARLAEVYRLVFHTGPAGGDVPLAEAIDLLAGLVGPAGIGTSDLLDAVEAERFSWGVSDGN